MLTRRPREPRPDLTAATTERAAAARTSATGFLARTVLAIGDIVAGFYGFWLVWRLLLPVLPGPAERRERIAPFACYFTDPLVVPIARRARLPEWAVTLASLVIVAAALVTLDEVATSV